MASILLSIFFTLFPARAGVILSPSEKMRRNETVPRTRGGDPSVKITGKITSCCSPHARG